MEGVYEDVEVFQSTPPERGATFLAVARPLIHGISIHAPREGSDSAYNQPRGRTADFNPRPPRGERPRRYRWDPADLPRISIHAPREGSDGELRRLLRRRGISIHAPREGSDARQFSPALLPPYFNPRPPRGERLLYHTPGTDTRGFQSTPPERGATRTWRLSARQSRNFNPRPPRGERPRRETWSRGASYFNPRPPRGERPGTGATNLTVSGFQSTPPERGAT